MTARLALGALFVTLAGAPSARAQTPDGGSRGIESFEEEIESYGEPAELGVGRYVALLVSAQDYDRRSGIPDLKTPNHDITAIGGVLESQYGFEARYLRDATYESIIVALDGLTDELQEDDVLVVYYAGHGVAHEAEGRGYWLPTDATLTSTARWVSTDDVAAKARAMPARHVLVVADSCFSGMLTRDVDLVTVDQAAPGYREARKLAAERSRWVITSGGTEPVVDGGANGMSVFAHFFAEALTNAEDRYVTPDALFPKVRRGVAENVDQTPTQGKLIRGLQAEGQVVLLNLSACDNQLEVLAKKADVEAEQDWQESVIRAHAGGNDAAFLAATEAWIGRWSGKVVKACGEETVAEIARLPDAIRQRELLVQSGGDKRRRGPKVVAVLGGLVAGTGAAMLGVSNAWWAGQQEGFVVGDDGSVLPPNVDEQRQFRTMRALNTTGGVLLGVGLGTSGIGLGISLTDGGGAISLRRRF